MLYLFLLLLPFTNTFAQQMYPSRYTALWNSPYPASCATGGTQPDWNKFNISTNANASFLGATIATLYKAGNLPTFSGMGPKGNCIDGDWNCTNVTSKYGGLPQLTNLSEHLIQLTLDIERQIPDANWNGVANIDWEAWHPNFNSNKYDEYWIYVNKSEEIVLSQHPTWSPEQVTIEAEYQFNNASQKFWIETMRLCQKIRPHGVWGYYNYPVDSWDSSTQSDLSDTPLNWLYDEVTALFPSIYLYKMNATFNLNYIDRVMNQTRHVRSSRYARTGDLLPMYSFTWYDYDISFSKNPQTFLSPEDLVTEMIRGSMRWGLSGLIIWGASEDVETNTAMQCSTNENSLYSYIENKLGPAVLEASIAANNCSKKRCSNRGTCWGDAAQGEKYCDCDKGFDGVDCSSSGGGLPTKRPTFKKPTLERPTLIRPTFTPTFTPTTATSLPQLTTSNGKLTTSDGLFIPRGANYIRLNGSQGGTSRTTPMNPVYHSTFSSTLFNVTQAKALLTQLSLNGYNIVRVFIDHGDPNRKDNDGAVQNNYLSKQYMDNVATFVQLASKLNIYTIPTLELFPSYTSRYGCNATALEQELFPYPNAALFIPGCVRAKRQYAIDFLHELKQRLGSLSALGMVFIENELSISVGSQPFIGNEALVKSANGQEYNMKNASQRLQLYEESARFWSSQVRNGIKSVDENVLVGVGMFTYAAVGKTFASSKNLTKCKFKEDCRVPPRPSAIENVIDVLDVHVYQTPSWTGIAVDLASSDWQSLKKTTPIVMAEFGAFRKNPMVFANQTEAATAMVQQQIDSCKFGFSGWLFWTADTWEQPILWNFASAPKIGKYLSPKARVDPCSSTVVTPPSSTSSFPLYWNVDENAQPLIDITKYDILPRNYTQVGGSCSNPGCKSWTQGAFPSIKNDGTKINGGVPQAANLTQHLNLFAKGVTDWIPDPNWNGNAVLDFEEWTTIWEENDNILDSWHGKRYQNESIRIVRLQHPEFNNTQIEAMAKLNFETAASNFFIQSLNLGRKLRPHAKWGFYGVPANQLGPCSGTGKDTKCSYDGPDGALYKSYASRQANVIQASDALFPSIYLSDSLINRPYNASSYVTSIISEMVHLANGKPVYAYAWHYYHAGKNLIPINQTIAILDNVLKAGGNGVVYWGSSMQQKNATYWNWLKTVGGPAIKNWCEEKANGCVL